MHWHEWNALHIPDGGKSMPSPLSVNARRRRQILLDSIAAGQKGLRRTLHRCNAVIVHVRLVASQQHSKMKRTGNVLPILVTRCTMK